MKCDRCNKAAVVHEVTVKNGVKSEIHLCEDHASQAGVALPVTQPINQLLTQFVATKSSRAARGIRAVCPTCRLSFRQFRQSGTLGCPDCYEAFDRHLTPVIERAQNEAVNHSGKVPRRAGGSIDRQLLIQQLVKDLDEAIAAEQYERAAELRDRLANVGSSPDTPESAPATEEQPGGIDEI